MEHGRGDGERLAAVEQGESFRGIAALCALRRMLPALTTGGFIPLSVERRNVVFTFVRGGENKLDPVVVVINAGGKEQATGVLGLVTGEGKPLFAVGDKIQRLPITGTDAADLPSEVLPLSWKDGVPQFETRVGPESLNLYRCVH